MTVLFSPARIGPLEIPNRFIHSATYEHMAEADGTVTDALVKRYVTLAKGEVGLIITGHMNVHPAGKAAERQTGIYSDEMIPGLRRLTEAVHDEGGLIAFQLAHAGRQTNRHIAGVRPMAPSSRGRDPVYFVKPREMTEQDVRETIEAFGAAAARAAEAGADGVQIHAAHGYLLSQFLSPYFNRRSDAWGGSEENRFRLLAEVCTAVRKNLPDTMSVTVKMNYNDFTPQPGITPDLAASYAKRLADLGIDGIEISCGTILYSFMNVCRGEVPLKELTDGLPFYLKPVGKLMMGRWSGKYGYQEPYNLPEARRIRQAAGDVTIAVVGGMRSVREMEQAVTTRAADFVSMCRPFIREPFLVKRFKEGKADRASCVSCNKCLAAIANRQVVKCYYKPVSS